MKTGRQPGIENRSYGHPPDTLFPLSREAEMQCRLSLGLVTVSGPLRNSHEAARVCVCSNESVK